MNNNFTDHELELKAAGANFSIFAGSDVITTELQKNVEEFKDFGQEDINKVYFIVSYVLLFHAQKILWERGPFENENNASTFEKYLFTMFQKTTGKDPMTFIKDLVDYIRKDDKEQGSRQIQYIGSKLCKEFNKEDAFLMLKIVSIFSTLLPAFYESMKNSWDLPDNILEKMLSRIETT